MRNLLGFTIAFTFMSMALAMPAVAALSRAALDSAGVRLPPQARLDLSITAVDAFGKRRSLRTILAGKPAFLNFIDYTCNTLCGTDLMLLADGVRRAKLDPASFRIVIMGIDPKDSAASAIKMEKAEIPPALRASTVLLLPDSKTIARATAALGFHYVYDPAIDQFAHPAVVYVLGPDGAVRDVLSPLSLTAGDLRRALIGPPVRAPGLYDRLHALCYAYDPATGLYTLRIHNILRIAGIMTVLVLASAVGFLIRRRSA